MFADFFMCSLVVLSFYCCVRTCATLHEAAGIDAGISSADVRTDTVRYNAAATDSGDAALYTASARGDAVTLVLLLLIWGL